MKITAGLGSLDDYETLVQAGADEVFCGYVPFAWNESFGNVMPLNRREVLFYHVQIGTYEEMVLLSRLMKIYQIPVAITLNALYYTQEQLPVIANMIRELSELGFEDYIIADIGLILYLLEEKITCRIHVSGELGEWNRGTLELLRSLCEQGRVHPELKRLIFHRKNTVEDMHSLISYAKSRNYTCEYEAFILNEMCHFTGGFCNSLHCDEMVHICQLPYQLVPMHKNMTYVSEYEKKEEIKECVGNTGCGLCALWQLHEVGVTHLKIVGRGKSGEEMGKDIRTLRRALNILNQSGDEKEYISHMKEKLLPNGCSHNCYYYEIVTIQSHANL